MYFKIFYKSLKLSKGEIAHIHIMKSKHFSHLHPKWAALMSSVIPHEKTL